MKVYVETKTVGRCFGTVGIVREVGSRKTLVEGRVRPYGFAASAADDAAVLAAARGWTVVEPARVAA
jgi:hypothetical protein